MIERRELAGPSRGSLCPELNNDNPNILLCLALNCHCLANMPGYAYRVPTDLSWACIFYITKRSAGGERQPEAAIHKRNMVWVISLFASSMAHMSQCARATRVKSSILPVLTLNVS